MNEGRPISPNEFEANKPGTSARDAVEETIERLRKKGGIFVDAVRATRMPMALTDPNLPGNPIVFANEAFLKLSGYTMDDVLGQQPHFMNGPGTDPNDAARFREMIRADQDEILETIQYRKNGSRFVATVLLSAFKDDEGRTLHHFMSWLDVTRRVDAEEEVSELRQVQAALQSSEAKYRGLFNAIDEGFSVIEVLFDEAGKAADYRFLEVNPAFERHTGLANAEGKTMRSLAPDHEEHWFERYGRIARTGEPERFEDAAAALGRWYDVYAFRIGDPEKHQVAIIFRDILLRRQAETTLRESEERQAFLLRLSDALRPLASAEAIQATTTRMLGMHLAVDRAMYSEVEGERGAEVGTIRGQYVRAAEVDEPPVEPFPERFTYESYGEQIMDARYAGTNIVVADIGAVTTFSEEERKAWLDAGVAAAIVAPLVKDGRLIVEFGIHSRTPRVWTESEVSLVQDVAERTWDAAQRATAETALRASEEKYRTLFESMDEAYAVVEVLKDDAGNWADFRFLDANPAFLEHTSMPYPVGRTATELLGTPNPRWTELYGQALDSGKPLRIEESEPTLGLIFDLNIFSLDRERNRVAILFTNITERKGAEAALQDSERHAQILLGELQHRVRNTLAVVRSIARRTADQSDTKDEMVLHFEGRLNAFSRVQSAVARNPEAGLALGIIIEDELVSVAAREGEQFRMTGPEVCLRSKPAESISLAIHELATNAVKYGALSVDNGCIRVRWDVQVAADGRKTLDLDWIETGLDVPPDGSHEGFGHEMLRRTLPYDLGADTDIQFTEDGMRFTMKLPLTPDILAKPTP